ncbi:hypothetical protein [Ruegeria atlantica]|uniref:Uncharacterized protein n=1 Tax=Ruegeria atlantica TaxID=81569 RepID=A0A0P1EG08_9RHOB|nr:hypothetical protein [Ruegeria atlantica]CUH48960.1 hypothetical protein RUA4292_03151 [Ruegeria atlantica]
MSDRTITRALRDAAVKAAEAAGYTVSRQTGVGRGPNQRLVLEEDGKTKTAALRTSRDFWVAFPPDGNGGWKTLDDVDTVLLAINDDYDNPTKATTWLLDADKVRDCFNERAAVMTERGQTLRAGMGVWVSAYPLASDDHHVAGSGMVKGVLPLAVDVPLEPGASAELAQADVSTPIDDAIAMLAEELGIDADRISISIRGV